jgi:hypothetical protein
MQICGRSDRQNIFDGILEDTRTNLREFSEHVYSYLIRLLSRLKQSYQQGYCRRRDQSTMDLLTRDYITHFYDQFNQMSRQITEIFQGVQRLCKTEKMTIYIFQYWRRRLLSSSGDILQRNTKSISSTINRWQQIDNENKKIENKKNNNKMEIKINNSTKSQIATGSIFDADDD